MALDRLGGVHRHAPTAGQDPRRARVVQVTVGDHDGVAAVVGQARDFQALVERGDRQAGASASTRRSPARTRVALPLLPLDST
ncbi:MAG: hypothetical protein ACYS26_10395 [Planctomycetota bacterium]|jgi:hypothetical protein